jgi:predicted alpha/beta superfamily hydrolase
MLEFVVRLPEITSTNQRAFLAGDGPCLGDWCAAAVPLEPLADGTRRAWLDLPSGFRGRFLVTLGRWRDVEGDGRGHERSMRELSGGDSGSIDVEVSGWGRTSIRYHHDFPSRFLPHPRTLSVWLPPGYDLEPERHFPVLYMHDGQNLFDAHTAFAGNPWYADEVAERVVLKGEVEPFIMVGVANTVDRLREYGPRQSGQNHEEDWSSEYGRFLVEEVKPFIDGSYRTLHGPEQTGVGGSSMGGLISLHLCKSYPDTFGKCAAMSPSLWWDRECFLQNVHSSPQWLEHCRVWLDMGTREGASEAGMQAMVGRARRLAEKFSRMGRREGRDYRLFVAEDGLHNEAAWGGRFDQVLRFLFGKS